MSAAESMVVCDTSVLVRLSNPDDPHWAVATSAVESLLSAGRLLAVLPQCLIEFWGVATRPRKANGLELDVSSTELRLAQLEAAFQVLAEHPDSYGHWRRLVAQYGVQGKRVHDVRIVATMFAHGLREILTFNVDDFSGIEGISAISPEAV